MDSHKAPSMIKLLNFYSLKVGKKTNVIDGNDDNLLLFFRKSQLERALNTAHIDDIHSVIVVVNFFIKQVELRGQKTLMTTTEFSGDLRRGGG